MAPRDRLSRIAERYWDEQASPGNPLSPQYIADALAAERRTLADVLAVPRAGLDADSRLTYDILKRRLELDIEGFTYPAELLPVSPFDGMPLQLARSAADTAQHPLKSAKDYEDWVLQIDDYAGWTEQAIANMREGMRRGYTSPRSLMERMLPLLQASRRGQLRQRVLSAGADPAADLRCQRTHADGPEHLPAPSKTSCCRRSVSSTISFKTNICRGLGSALPGRPCPWDRPGTHSGSSAQPAPH